MWKIQFNFSYRATTWDKFPAKDGNFYKATFGGGDAGETLYKSASFKNLFDVDFPSQFILP